MIAFLKSFEEPSYALMRMVVGLLILCHGTSRLFGFPVPADPDASALIRWIFGPIEVLGGTSLMLGGLTRWMALILSAEMAAGYWARHGTSELLPLANHFPIANGGELATVLCFVLLFIACRGSGIWSVDRTRGVASRRT